ncbi:MAG: nicotinate-nucleotide--dimethylbenzimidazole phosphoribosyltransferase, partial [Coriobacteriales bacterium]|jgi:nicotinate-nucleotide--dimethylbenzimidazole phosphoribosyltransferase|nr:nicotinate-nucleotide--dimethylbenzimidazole phosphoribosyltransferase [Coriobacteriales bacterium]
MIDFTELNARIPAPDDEAAARTQVRLNNIAKPVASLGELESLLVRISRIARTDDIALAKRQLIVLAADNGVTAQGVAATPADITAVMASFMAERRSSVCIMADTVACDVALVDIGMFRHLDVPGIVDLHVADGTADMSQGPAMSREQALQAIEVGIDLAHQAAEQGYRLIATGEMGIGNTSTSSAVAAVLLGRTASDMTGRGVGLTDEGLAHKVAVISQAIEVNHPDPADAFDVLRMLGGFDIAAMCGVFLGGALYGVPVIIDGFISSVAALCAVRLCPAASYALLPSHLSAEPAACAVLAELGLEPIIHAGMHLGEGTGAVALIGLLDQAVAVYDKMITYADIGM